jgi:3-phenylpropionate/trans-cinnamate dioxygenase ferredoxin subunit
MSDAPTKVCAVDDLADGTAIVVPTEVSGWPEPIAVFRDGGEFFALDDTCSHEQASLAEGWIEAGEIECPLHQSRFNLRTGEVTDLPATRPVRAHLVEVRDGQVWLSPGVTPGTAT